MPNLMVCSSSSEEPFRAVERLEEDSKEKLPEHVKVGQQLFLDGNINEPVVVRFVGPTRFNKKGIWIGIALIAATGKHGGSVDGHRYFSCKPKHGMFVRAERLFDDYFCPGDGTPTSKKANGNKHNLPIKLSPKKQFITPKPIVQSRFNKTAAHTRKHPLLDKANSGKDPKKTTLRYYIDAKGRRMHTLKEVDPYGRPTLLLIEPVEKVLKCNCAHHAVSNNPSGAHECSTCDPNEDDAKQKQQQQHQLKQEKRQHERLRIQQQQAQLNLQKQQEQLRKEQLKLQQQQEQLQRLQKEADEQSTMPIEVPERAEHSDHTSDFEEELESVGQVQLVKKEDIVAPLVKKILRPGATGLSDDEDDEDEDVEDDNWLQGSSLLFNQTMSTVEECRALSKRIRSAAIKDNWDDVRNMLCDEAAALVVDEDILLQSGIGKIVGKLRQAPVLAVGFAADTVIEGWKFQLKLEPTESTKIIQAKTDALARKVASYDASKDATITTDNNDADNNNATASPSATSMSISDIKMYALNDGNTKATKSTDNGDINSPVPVKPTATTNARRKLEKSLEPPPDADDLLPEDEEDQPMRTMSGTLSADEDDDVDDAFTAIDTSKAPPKIEAETFVALTMLDQCEAAIEDMKGFITADDWDQLLEFLRLKIQPLLVTEEDLRRSNIGKVLAKIVKHSGTHVEVKHQAQEILEMWKEKLHHRDPELEKIDQAERIEREKFLAYMNLHPAELHPEFKVPNESDSEFEEEDTNAGGAVYYTKKLEIIRGPKDKSLGFDMTLGMSKTGGLKATVENVVVDGLADRCKTEGVVMEVDDEIIEVNGAGVENLSQAGLIGLMKAQSMTLTLKSLIPGTYENDGVKDEDVDLYRTTDNRLFDKVKQSDFVTLA